MVAPSPDDDLVDLARRVIDANLYLVLGTIDADGRPRLSPLFFTSGSDTPGGDSAFYWVSSPHAHHSHNVAERPDVELVVFDSTAPIGRGEAVYLSATAGVVADGDLPSRAREAFPPGGRGGVAFDPEELSSGADLRLYRARATRCEVHIPGGHPSRGRGVDHREAVPVARLGSPLRDAP